MVVDDEINAFAAPAGYIYVNTGTILRARNVASWPACSPTRSATSRAATSPQNSAQQRAGERGAPDRRRGGARSPPGRPAPAPPNLLGGLASLAALNSFGREAEREADAFAVEVLPRRATIPRAW